MYSKGVFCCRMSWLKLHDLSKTINQNVENSPDVQKNINKGEQTVSFKLRREDLMESLQQN